MDNAKSPPSNSASQLEEGISEDHLSRITRQSFDEWYQEQERAQNIREGQHYFNYPGRISSPSRHSPSSLLQCQRKSIYKHLNSPEEDHDPNGIFWFGNRFEEEVIMPYLTEVVTQKGTYACNSLWIDFSVETNAGKIRIKGETDPVIVDEHASPLLLLEVKTKRSIEDLSTPNPHHKAQVHAYLYGLAEEYEQYPETAAIIYASRTSLDIEVFEVEFDEDFWEETVLDWASKQTSHRIHGDLPPSNPEYDWECEFCSFRERCGRGEREYSDGHPTGFLPVYSDYPRQKVLNYLEVHTGSKLTPTLAQAYPELVEKYGSYDWSCSKCEAEFNWDEIKRRKAAGAPECPECKNNGHNGWLSGPTPAEQHELRREANVE